MTQAIDQPLKPRRRWLRRIAIILITLACLMVLGYFLVLRVAVREQILSALADAGVKHASLDLGWVTPWRTELRNVSLGDQDPISIDRVTAEYSPQTLFAGRVRGVRIDGVQLTTRQRDGRFELGPLREILARPHGEGSSDTEQPLPLDSITVTNAILRIGGGATPAKLALNGTLRQAADGRLNIRFESTDTGAAFTIIGNWDAKQRTGECEFKAAALDAAAVVSLTEAALPDLGFTAGGTIQMTAKLAIPAQGPGALTATIQSNGVKVGKSGSTNVQDVTGVFHLTSDVAGGELSNVIVNVDAANFRSTQYALAVEGLNGRIEIANPLTPEERVAQSLKIKRLGVGATELFDGTIDFGLRGWKSIQINQTAWQWLDGTVSSRNINVDPRTYRIDAAMKVEHLDLRGLLEFLAKEKATGQGRVSGELALMIDWPRIQLGDGQLWAEGGGNLKIIDTAAIDGAVGQSVEAGSGQQVRQNVVEALKDFQYDSLRAQLVKNQDGATALVKIMGRGRAGERQPIDLDLRVQGLNELLNAYLGIQDKITGGE